MSTKPTVTNPQTFSLAEEITKSIKSLSTAALQDKINSASSNRNRIAAGLRKAQDALVAVASDLGKLDMLSELSPDIVASKEAELTARERDLRDQKRKLEAEFIAAGEIIPLVENELRDREQAATLATRELLLRRFPEVYSKQDGAGRFVKTQEASTASQKIAELLIGQALRESFFNQNINPALISGIPGLAQNMLNEAQAEARQEAQDLIEQARMQAGK